jgi:uncharacterized membrane protein YfcA
VSALDAVIIVLAGMGAGTINAVVGSGSLITFPTLVALGYPPLLANVSNNIGLVPGSISGVYGYRRELVGQSTRLRRLVPASVLGAGVGAGLLLTLPSTVFDSVVILLITIALVLVVLQPVLAVRLGAARGRDGDRHPDRHRDATIGVQVLVALTGVYGGYFGAAQGIVLISILGIMIDDHLQRLNACKNVLAGSVNAVAAVIFVIATDVDWAVVGCIAAGSTIGGQIGARSGRRLDPRALRVFIVVVGVIALVRLL